MGNPEPSIDYLSFFRRGSVEIREFLKILDSNFHRAKGCNCEPCVEMVQRYPQFERVVAAGMLLVEEVILVSGEGGLEGSKGRTIPLFPGSARRSTRKDRPDSVDEVRGYFNSYDLRGDPESFFDFWESRGWRDKVGPIRDWRARARVHDKEYGKGPRPSERKPAPPVEMPKSRRALPSDRGEDVWVRTCENLKVTAIAPRYFKTWFSPIEQISFRPALGANSHPVNYVAPVLTLALPNDAFRWSFEHWKDSIASALRSVAGCPVTLVLTLRDEWESAT